MNYAVITTGGKQYKVAEGDIIDVEKLESEEGKDIVFDTVLFYAAGDAFQVGTPAVAGATVTGQIVQQFKGTKIRVSKFKAKARYRKTIGHRQSLTKVQIKKITVKKDK